MNSVSVIVSCYNGAEFLAEAIDSALAQTHPVEVVVVDDGSTDSTAEVCARYPNVDYIYQHNQGVSVARNTGIHATKGEFLIFLDCDDRLMPNTAEVGVKTFLTTPDLGAVFSYYHEMDMDGVLSSRPPAPPQAIPGYVALLRGEILVPPSCWMIRRAALEVVGEFTVSLRRAEDSDLWLRIARVFPIAATNQLGCQYRRHPGNISNNAARMLEDCLRMLSYQEKFIQQSANPVFKAAYEYGRKSWIKQFGSVMPYQIAHALRRGQWATALKTLRLLFRYYPQGLIQYFSWLSKSILSAITLLLIVQPLSPYLSASPSLTKRGIKPAVSSTQLWKRNII